MGLVSGGGATSPRPLLLPGFTTAGGVSGTTSMSDGTAGALSGVLTTARCGEAGGRDLLCRRHVLHC